MHLQDQSSQPLSSKIIGLFIVLLLIWSLTPLSVVVSLRELHPLWSLSLRFIFAAPIAILITLALGIKLPINKQSVISYVAGSLGIYGSMLLVYLAGVSVNSGTISLLFASSTLLSGIGLWWLGKQGLSLQQWIGCIVSLVGLAIALGVTHTESKPGVFIGIILICLAVILYVASMFWVIHVGAKIHPLAQTSGSLAVGVIASICLLPFIWSQHPTHMPSVDVVLALVFSILMASVVAFVVYFKLVSIAKPTTVALTTIFTPILASVWGHWLNQEPLTINLVIGIVVVVCGLWLYLAKTFFQAS